MIRTALCLEEILLCIKDDWKVGLIRLSKKTMRPTQPIGPSSGAFLSVHLALSDICTLIDSPGETSASYYKRGSQTRAQLEYRYIISNE